MVHNTGQKPMVLSRLVKRVKSGTWYYVRRVPQEYQAFDPRTIIQKSTDVRISDDPRGVKARRVANGIDSALEVYWKSLAIEGPAKALAEYQAACHAAVKLGVSPPLQDKSERTIAELLERIEMLQRGRIAEDTNNVAALLDDAPSPKLTFRQCAEQYIESHKAGWSNAKHAAQWSTSLEQFAYPVIGTMSVAQLSGHTGTHKIKSILDPIWRTKTATAHRVRGRIEKVLDWAKAQGFREGENPARWTGHLDAIYPTKEKIAPTKHHVAMPFRDIPGFMGKLREQTGIGARALEFTILTASRASEVLEAKRSEIDREGRIWVIPKERMKMRREHRVPLSASALKIIDTLPQDSEFLFPGRKEGKPLDHKTLQRVLNTLGVKVTPHGFRSTFRDFGAEEGDYPNELLELALAHAVGNKVEAAYRRGSQLEKRYQLMADWGVYCNG
jgi:integrase